MERRIRHGWCLTVAIACALGACAGKGSDGSDDDKASASSQKNSSKKQQRAPKDAGMAQDADAAAMDDAAMAGNAGGSDAFVPTLDEPPAKYDCTYAGDAKARHGYWFCSAKTMREDARSLCTELGGDFVVIEDAQENTWIADHIEADTYIGYSDALEEGSWMWVDESEGSYTNWDEMEPTEADFAFIEKASGRWKSTVATARAFACEGSHLFKD